MKETERELELKQLMGNLLRKIRIANGINSIGVVTKELKLSQSTLPKIETGENFPNARTLDDLMGVYKTTTEEYKQIKAWRKEILAIRRARRRI
jgi:transcriptional regulator with XRE-family HTH domain